VAATSWQWPALAVSFLLLAAAALWLPLRLGFSYRSARGEEAARLVLVLGAGPLTARIPLGGRDGRPAARAPGSARARPGTAPPSGPAAPIQRVRRILRRLRPALRVIERLEWRTELGTGDAAATAVLTGVLWALKSALVGFLARERAFLRRPEIRVLPDYRRTVLAFEISCIFRFTLGDIIRGARAARAIAQRE